MDLGLDGRRALITGASKGIGRAIAAALVAEGAAVAIASRTRQNIEAAAGSIGAIGLAWDSADVDGAGPLVTQAEQAMGGPIDVLVCNTGGPPAGADPFGFTAEQWEAAHRTLVLAPMALVGAVVPGMRVRGWGRVLNVASTSVREPIGALMLSNAERSAAVAAWKTIAREVAGDGVTVNTVLPGTILTDRLISLSGGEDAARASAAASVPARRPGTVEEFAAASVFLCSEPASYITGVALPIDGGRLHGI